MFRTRAPLLIFLFLSVVAGADIAAAVDIKVNEFASLVIGDIIHGDASADTGSTPCPCYVADYGNGFIYTQRRPLIATETRAGVQVNVNLTDSLSAVAQVVARAEDAQLSLEWAYLSYDITPNLTVQAGKMRIPIFYYSAFQDVGYAYIWLRPPGELYGWDMTNYLGASLRYRFNLGDLNVSSSFFAGSGRQHKDGFFKVYQTTPVEVRWNNIRGVDTELTYEWLTARAVYIQSTNQYNEGTGWGDYAFDTGTDTKQQIFGLALNLDFGKVFALSETNLIRHYGQFVQFRSPAYSVGAGWRLGNFTPFLNYADYTDQTTTPSTYQAQRFDEWSATLRYDFAKGQDVKLQYNWLRDMSPVKFSGYTQLASASYDLSL